MKFADARPTGVPDWQIDDWAPTLNRFIAGGGGEVPPGLYIVRSQLVARSLSRLHFAPGSVVQTVGLGAANAVVVDGVNDFELCGVRLIHRCQAPTADSGHVVYLRNSSKLLFDSIECDDWVGATGGSFGSVFWMRGSVQNIEWRNLECFANDNDGSVNYGAVVAGYLYSSPSGEPSDLLIEECKMGGPGVKDALALNGHTPGAIVRRVKVRNVAGRGIVACYSYGDNLQPGVMLAVDADMTVDDCEFFACPWGAAAFMGGGNSGFKLRGSRIRKCGGGGPGVGAAAVYHQANSVIISGNDIRDSGYDVSGAARENGGHAIHQARMIQGTRTDGSGTTYYPNQSDSVYEDNHIYGSRGSDIQCETVDRLTISGGSYRGPIVLDTQPALAATHHVRLVGFGVNTTSRPSGHVPSTTLRIGLNGPANFTRCQLDNVSLAGAATGQPGLFLRFCAGISAKNVTIDGFTHGVMIQGDAVQNMDGGAVVLRGLEIKNAAAYGINAIGTNGATCRHYGTRFVSCAQNVNTTDLVAS